jgi:MFS family permease
VLATGPASPRVGGSYLGLLRRNRDFRLLYAATLISLAGDWFLTVALVDLVLAMTGKATLVALVSLCMCLPVFLLAPWAGAAVDRSNRRHLMIAMDLVRAGAALLPLLATAPGRLPLALVGVCIISTCSAFFDPAADAALPNLVAAEDLGRANVLLGSAWGTMMALGAALGGLVMVYGGRTSAFVIDGLSFLLSAALILRIRVRFTAPRTPEHTRVALVDSVRETVRYARAQPRVLALLIAKAGYGLGAGLITLLGLFGEQVFQRGAKGISLMLVARGSGVVLGPFLLHRVLGGGPSYRQCRAIAPCVTLFALGYLGLAVSPILGLGMLAVAVAHMGAGAQWQACTYGLQSMVPDRLRGRIFAADYGLLTLSLSISSMGAGLLADRYGVRRAALGLATLGLLWALVWELSTRRLWVKPSPDAEPIPSPSAAPG